MWLTFDLWQGRLYIRETTRHQAIALIRRLRTNA